MRLVYSTRFGIKFNPILDNPIFNAITDILFGTTTQPLHAKAGQEEVMNKHAYTNHRHLRPDKKHRDLRFAMKGGD